MKLFVLILSAFLSGLFSGGNVYCEDTRCGDAGTVLQPKGQNGDSNDPYCKSIGILPVRTAGYSGEDNSVTPSVRCAKSGSSVHTYGKSPFRVIKDGKVIDKHNFHTFQTDLKQFPSGIHSTNRYIHSLCQLLI